MLTSLLVWTLTSPALADEPVSERLRLEGTLGHQLAGTSLAADTDLDGRVDTLAQPASFTTDTSQIPAGSTLIAATLYWGGTQADPGVACTGTGDNTVSLTRPDAGVLNVVADRCDCADGGAAAYDVWTCSADLTAALGTSPLAGTWSVDGYTGLVANNDTDHAVASLLLVAEHASLPNRTVVVADGLQTVVNDTTTVSVPGLSIDGLATGSLSWMVLEGDVGVSANEYVDLLSSPSGAGGLLSNAGSPVDDPMNRSITTTIPAQSDVVGLDLDRFDLAGLLTAGDTALDVTFSAGLDKYWPVALVVSVDAYIADLAASNLVWSLDVDADVNGVVSPGDTLSFTLTLDNAGSADALVDVSDVIPAELSTWTLTDDGNGTDVSSPGTLLVDDVLVPAGSTVSVSFEGTVADVPDATSFTSTASWTGDDSGSDTTTSIDVRTDTDSDGIFDLDDLCPADFDPLQVDTDSDGLGDACDGCPEVTGPGGADSDNDTIPDECDVCPVYDDRLDADGDLVPDGCEQCPGEDDRLDADGDGVPDGCDVCKSGDDSADSDGDEVADACDVCEGYDDNDDADGDGIPNACDTCNGDDRNDADNDTVPDACDICPQGDDLTDTDNDSVPDACDECPMADDTADADNDGVADACDACEGYDDAQDADNDTVPDDCDVCFGNDFLDADSDTVPDACDVCADGDDRLDADLDGIPNACDTCDGVDDTADADGDTIPDACDLCDGGDDRNDADNDTVPDDCDTCPAFDDRIDNDGDTFADACDVCPFAPDPGQLDNDGDGLGDACDPCPNTAFQTDTDLDGTYSCEDCDDSDPLLNADDNDQDGYSSCDGDCADDDDRSFPGAGETPNGADEDCDGRVDEGTARYDDDGDGFTELGGDCNDANPGIHPAAVELCNGADEDCDGLSDEGTECYDDDGDGFCEGPSCTDGTLPGDCNDGSSLTAPDNDEVQGNGIDDDCDGNVDDAVSDLDGDGVSVEGGDCDDSDPTTAPGFPELPDDVDNDCDGRIDEDTVRSDDDGDGWTELEGDCHDGDPNTSPGAPEVMDGRDNDCNGIVDDGSPGVDDDGDGYADAAGDCDDTDPNIYPGALESDNGTDDDCDGLVDEDFTDVDGDGVSFADGDCDDLEGWVNPGMVEMCDGLDNDCNGLADEDGACDDGSGQAKVGSSSMSGGGGCSTSGSPAGLFAVMLAAALARRRWLTLPLLGAVACKTDTGFREIQSRLAITPTTLVDFGDLPAGQTVVLPVTVTHLEGRDIQLYDIVLTDDAGGAFDYFGPDSITLFSGSTLDLPIRYQPSVEGYHTSRLEITHSGLTDQAAVDVRGHAVPMAFDTFPLGLDFGPVDVGEEAIGEVTLVNRGEITLTLDEAGTSSARFAALLDLPVEVEPGDELVVPVVFRPNSDAPARGELALKAGGAAAARIALWGNDCENGLVDAWDTDHDGFSACATDCDDSNPLANPGGTELPNGIDEDCDGLIDEGTTAADDDGDGFCDDAVFCTDGSQPGDCADQNAAVNPGVDEILDNGIDDDCDGRVDFGIADDDADGVALSGGDCDDLDPTVFPGAPEAADGVDNDCDGFIDEGTTGADDDGDGWCEGQACTDGSLPGDCDDTNPNTWPGADEALDWADNDCDAIIDEGTVHYDDDGDGYTEQGGDCDDNDDTLSPGLGTC